jgi:hypothetical protein
VNVGDPNGRAGRARTLASAPASARTVTDALATLYGGGGDGGHVSIRHLAIGIQSRALSAPPMPPHTDSRLRLHVAKAPHFPNSPRPRRKPTPQSKSLTPGSHVPRPSPASAPPSPHPHQPKLCAPNLPTQTLGARRVCRNPISIPVIYPLAPFTALCGPPAAVIPDLPDGAGGGHAVAHE